MAKHHVIIGGGPAATNAVETIRQVESEPSQITLICDEPAHSRMALPYWVSNQIPKEQTYTGDDAYFKKLNVETIFDSRAESIDAAAQQVKLADGRTVEYDNLLVATGSTPLELPVPGADLDGVQPLWTLAQAESLLKQAEAIKDVRVLMIGAGFIGFIMLNAMHKRGWNLSVVERESHVLPRMLDQQGASIVEQWLGSQGVDVTCGASVQAIREADDGSKIVELDDGTEKSADIVIVATGVKPNLDLFAGTEVSQDHGVLVNDRMQTNVEGVYAAGDIVQGPNLMGGDPEVHAIQPTAVDQGRIAGANMAGKDVAYSGSLLMNILDVCGLQNVSYGNWADDNAEKTTIFNPDGHVYRQLLWTGDEITGAICVGQASDVGMLTDVGMIKGIMQTRTKLGEWKKYLIENPFDIRRAYIACGVAKKLAETTLLGQPSQHRKYQFQNMKPAPAPSKAHSLFVEPLK